MVLRRPASNWSLLYIFFGPELKSTILQFITFFCFLMLQTTMSAILRIMDANKDVSIRVGVFIVHV